jgi:hypothetical protein
MQLSDLRETLLPRLKRLLPLLLMGLFGMANALLCASSVVPSLRLFDAASAERDAAAATLEAIQSTSDTAVMMRVLNRQLDSARADLASEGDALLTSAQADELIERLYWYADRAGVQVVSLQSQETSNAPDSRANEATALPSTAQPLEMRFLRLQVQGRMENLIRYMVDLREASSRAVVIDALDLTQGVTADEGDAEGATQSILTMSVTLYSSPFASGVMLTQLPPRAEFVPPQSSPVEAAVLPQASATSVATLVPTAFSSPTPSPSPTFAATATSVPTATPTVFPTDAPTALPSATPSDALIRLASLEEPPVEILFDETFDRDPLYAWTLGNGWSLVGLSSGRALQAANGTGGSVLLRYDDLGDAVIQMRFLLESGSMRVQLRESAAGNYTIEATDANVLTLYRADVPIQTAVFPGTLAGEWRTLRFSAFDNILRLAVDGAEQMIAFDSLSLPPGDVAIQNGGGVLYVDDVTVWTRGD